MGGGGSIMSGVGGWVGSVIQWAGVRWWVLSLPAGWSEPHGGKQRWVVQFSETGTCAGTGAEVCMCWEGCSQGLVVLRALWTGIVVLVCVLKMGNGLDLKLVGGCGFKGDC